MRSPVNKDAQESVTIAVAVAVADEHMGAVIGRAVAVADEHMDAQEGLAVFFYFKFAPFGRN